MNNTISIIDNTTKNNTTKPKTKRRSPTPKERLKSLLAKEQRLVSVIAESNVKLKEVRKEIEAAKREAVGLDFLAINTDEFMLILDNLEQMNMPPSEILKLFADGNINKLQEIYLGTKGGGASNVGR